MTCLIVFVGNSMNRCLEIITQLLGHPPPENFLEEYHARINVALESDLRPVPGLDEVLQGIKVPYCVASNGDRRKMYKTLGLTGLLSRFEGRIGPHGGCAPGRGRSAPGVRQFGGSAIAHWRRQPGMRCLSSCAPPPPAYFFKFRIFPSARGRRGGGPTWRLIVLTVTPSLKARISLAPISR